MTPDSTEAVQALTSRHHMWMVAVILVAAALLMMDGAATGLVWRADSTTTRRIAGAIGLLLCIGAGSATYRAIRPMVLWQADREGIRNHMDYLGRWNDSAAVPWSEVRDIYLRTEIAGDQRFTVIWVELRDRPAGSVVSAIRVAKDSATFALAANGDPGGEEALQALVRLRQQGSTKR